MNRSVIFAIASVLAAATAAYAAPPPANSSAAKAAPAARLVCRTYADTGSLVRSTRVCKTRREWEADNANIRAAQDGSSSCSANGATGETRC